MCLKTKVVSASSHRSMQISHMYAEASAGVAIDKPDKY